MACLLLVFVAVSLPLLASDPASIYNTEVDGEAWPRPWQLRPCVPSHGCVPMTLTPQFPGVTLSVCWDPRSHRCPRATAEGWWGQQDPRAGGAGARGGGCSTNPVLSPTYLCPQPTDVSKPSCVPRLQQQHPLPGQGHHPRVSRPLHRPQQEHRDPPQGVPAGESGWGPRLCLAGGGHPPGVGTVPRADQDPSLSSPLSASCSWARRRTSCVSGTATPSPCSCSW